MRTLASELGTHVDRFTARPRIYVDANMPAGVVAHMRERLRWDIVFVVEDDGLRRASDEAHYRLARKLRRTLVSLDRDYLDDRRFPIEESGGVVVLSAPDERGLIHLLTRIDRRLFGRGRGHEPRRDPPLLGKKIHAEPEIANWSSPPARQRTSPRRR